MSTTTGRPRPFLDGVYRTACNYCVSSKRGCSGGEPCEQCEKRGKTCVYAQRRKSGPRGRPASGRSGKGRSRAKARRDGRAAVIASSPRAGSGNLEADSALDASAVLEGARAVGGGDGASGAPFQAWAEFNDAVARRHAGIDHGCSISTSTGSRARENAMRWERRRMCQQHQQRQEHRHQHQHQHQHQQRQQQLPAAGPTAIYQTGGNRTAAPLAVPPITTSTLTRVVSGPVMSPPPARPSSSSPVAAGKLDVPPPPSPALILPPAGKAYGSGGASGSFGYDEDDGSSSSAASSASSRPTDCKRPRLSLTPPLAPSVASATLSPVASSQSLPEPRAGVTPSSSPRSTSTLDRCGSGGSGGDQAGASRRWLPALRLNSSAPSSTSASFSRAADAYLSAEASPSPSLAYSGSGSGSSSLGVRQASTVRGAGTLGGGQQLREGDWVQIAVAGIENGGYVNHPVYGDRAGSDDFTGPAPGTTTTIPARRESEGIGGAEAPSAGASGAMGMSGSVGSAAALTAFSLAGSAWATAAPAAADATAGGKSFVGGGAGARVGPAAEETEIAYKPMFSAAEGGNRESQVRRQGTQQQRQQQQHRGQGHPQQSKRQLSLGSLLMAEDDELGESSSRHSSGLTLGRSGSGYKVTSGAIPMGSCMPAKGDASDRTTSDTAPAAQSALVSPVMSSGMPARAVSTESCATDAGFLGSAPHDDSAGGTYSVDRANTGDVPPVDGGRPFPLEPLPFPLHRRPSDVAAIMMTATAATTAAATTWGGERGAAAPAPAAVAQRDLPGSSSSSAPRQRHCSSAQALPRAVSLNDGKDGVGVGGSDFVGGATPGVGGDGTAAGDGPLDCASLANIRTPLTREASLMRAVDAATCSSLPPSSSAFGGAGDNGIGMRPPLSREASLIRAMEVITACAGEHSSSGSGSSSGGSNGNAQVDCWEAAAELFATVGLGDINSDDVLCGAGGSSSGGGGKVARNVTGGDQPVSVFAGWW